MCVAVVALSLVILGYFYVLLLLSLSIQSVFISGRSP